MQKRAVPKPRRSSQKSQVFRNAGRTIAVFRDPEKKDGGFYYCRSCGSSEYADSPASLVTKTESIAV
ncbi:MAG: hypothetical protein M1587_05540 [Thaumarchaeota archaeon]|nr:hypothetical protein [Nitrososphaerota archaeon]